MVVQPYINFNGTCKDAVEFYAKVFKTEKPNIMKFGDAPPNPEFQLPPGAKDLVMHTQLQIGESTLMFSDTFPSMPFIAGNNISLTYMSSDEADIRRIFDELKIGGTVNMKLQQTFWSKCYGSITDRFGIPWQLSYEEKQA
jgi:PhnB protein